ncbi:MAG: electron transport complex subunit RsxB [Burkholderiales bacterium]|nr:electron transport complex subunit RsxB [Burkholderiales bacterium]
MSALAERLLDALPQTQCTRCGYPDCAGYAQALADGKAALNQCPPGGAEGVARLAAILGQPVRPLSAEHGVEGPRTLAVIDENWCIGCTLCIKACPTDAIVGSNKHMHTVIEPWCTGCELCIPACPVDCISLENVTGERTGWAAWSQVDADAARQRYERRTERQAREATEHQQRLQARAHTKLADLPAHTHGAQDADELARKRAVIEAVLAKARARQGGA